jgi:hypothetical protein
MPRHVPCLALALLALPASSQQTLGHIDGSRGDMLARLVPIEDLTGDGVPELVALALDGRGFGPTGPLGRQPSADLHWYDGASLTRLGGSVAGDVDSYYGIACVAAGDFDADGVTDVLWHHGTGGVAPYAEVHSGATQELLARFPGPVGAPTWGEVLAALGDVDQDGFDDVGVASHGSGEMRVYGGPHGHLIRAHMATGTGHRSLAGVGDVDGDGVPDYAFGDGGSGEVRLFSGATGHELRRDRRAPQSGFGHALAAAGDMDEDGVPDYVAAAPGSAIQPQPISSVHVVSGATGLDLRAIVAAVDPTNRLGATLDASRDLNGDGVRDLVVTTIEQWYVHVYSLRTGSLLFRVHAKDIAPAGRPAVSLPFAGMLPDLDGDGLPDWWLGQPAAEAAPMDLSGRVTLLRGAYGDATRYCPAAPNSTSSVARLEFLGPITVGHAGQRIQVVEALPGSFAQLVYGTAQSPVPFGGGLLCVGGALERSHAPFPLDAQGAGSLAIDWSTGPHTTGNGAWLPGAAIALQVVYRDGGAPAGAGFNTTDAVRVVFNQ